MIRAIRSLIAMLLLLSLTGPFWSPSAIAQDADTRPDLVIAAQTVPDNLRESIFVTFVKRINVNIYDPVIARDWGPEGTGSAPVPSLAESWEQVSPTELELTIREGVLFHNGQVMTAEDVAFTLSEEKLWGPEALTPEAAASVFEAVDVVDERTVRITTKHPDLSLVSRLQSSIANVVPKDYYLELGVDGFGQAPVGTGPYKVESFSPRDEVRLVAFDDYWGGKPPVRSLTFKAVPEVSARVAGLITGEFDIATNIPPVQIPLIEGNEGLEIRSVLTENVQMIAFITTQSDVPTSNKLVRQAMAHAIDRDLIVEQLFGGLTTPVAGFQLPAHGEYYDPERAPLAYDPDRARELLQEAGYAGEGIVFQFITNQFTLSNEFAQVMQQMWQAVGLKVSLDIVPDFSLLTLSPDSRTNAYLTSNSAAFPDPLSPIWTNWGPNSFFVTGGRHVPSDEFVALGNTLEQSVDFEQRYEAFQAMQDLWDDEVPAILLWPAVEIFGVRSDIAWQPNADFGMDFRASSFAIED